MSSQIFILKPRLEEKAIGPQKLALGKGEGRWPLKKETILSLMYYNRIDIVEHQLPRTYV